MENQLEKVMISPEIWKEKTFLRLTPTDKLVYLYLLTTTHGNAVGLYYLPLEYAAHDLSLTINQIKVALNTLVEKNLISYDIDNAFVFLPNFAKEIANIHHITRLRKFIKQTSGLTPIVAELKKTIMNKTKESSNVIKSLLTDAFPIGVKFSQKKLRIEAEDGEPKKRGRRAKATITPPGEKKLSAEKEKFFEAFWDAYPRKESRTALRNLFYNMAVSPSTGEVLISAAKAYAAKCIAEGTDMQYIKLPTNFIRSGAYAEYAEATKQPEYKSDDDVKEILGWKDGENENG